MLYSNVYERLQYILQNAPHEPLHPAVNPSPVLWMKQFLRYEPVSSILSLILLYASFPGAISLFATVGLCKLINNGRSTFKAVLKGILFPPFIIAFGAAAAAIYTACLLCDFALWVTAKAATSMLAFFTIPFRKPLSHLLVRTSYRIQRVHATRLSNQTIAEEYTTLIDTHMPPANSHWVVRCVENALYYALFPFNYLIDFFYQSYIEANLNRDCHVIFYDGVKAESFKDTLSIWLIPPILLPMVTLMITAAALAVPVGLIGAIVGVITAPFISNNKALSDTDARWAAFRESSASSDEHTPLVLNTKTKVFTTLDGKKLEIDDTTAEVVTASDRQRTTTKKQLTFV